MTAPIGLLEFISVFAVGGTERQFLYLTRNLDRSRFDVHIACLWRWGALLEEIEALNGPVVEFKIPNLYSYSTARQQFRLARYIRRHGIRIVCAYGFGPNVFMLPAAKFAGNCVTIASVRDTGVYLTPAKKRVQMIACRLADCVLANSNAVRDWLISGGVAEDKIRVIRNGVPIPVQSDTAGDFPIRREFQIDLSAPLITVVCRLERRKGLEFFLQAAVTMSQRFPAARFLVVGDSIVDPHYKTELEWYAAELGLAGRAIFTGQRHDVANVLREATLSVLPSLSESVSNSLIEAMAAGVPVVATNVGGNPEVVQEGANGFLVPPADAGALSHAMIRILESPELARRFGEAGRARAIQYFSIESLVRQTEELYLALLGQKKLLPKSYEQTGIPTSGSKSTSGSPAARHRAQPQS